MDFPLRRSSFKRSSSGSSSYKQHHQRNTRNSIFSLGDDEEEEIETHLEEHHPILSHHHRHSHAAASAPELCSPTSPTSPAAGDVIVKIDASPAAGHFGTSIQSRSIRRTNSDASPVGSPWRGEEREMTAASNSPSQDHEFSFQQQHEQDNGLSNKPSQFMQSRPDQSPAPMAENLIEESPSSKLIGRFLEHQRVAAAPGENMSSSEIEMENEELRQRRRLPPLPPENLLRQGWSKNNQNDVLSPSFSVLSDYRNAIANRNGSNASNNYDGSSRENRVSFQESLNSELVGRGGSIYSNIDGGSSTSSSTSSLSRGEDDDNNDEMDSRINSIGVNSRITINGNQGQGQGFGHSGEMLRSGSNNGSLLRRGGSISAGSKAKSRLMDRPPTPLDQRSGFIPKSGTFNMRSSDCLEEEDDPSLDDDLPEEFKRAHISTLVVLEWVSLVTLVGSLICSLIIPPLKLKTVLKMRLWKWEVLILVLICGRLVSGWVVRIIVFFIERNFLLRKRVLYFVYGLKKAVQNVIWLGLVLLAWHLVFDKRVEREANSEPLRVVTKLLVILEIGAVVWLLKTLLIKVCASNFHVSAFFDRIQESLFNQFVIETLSGPPLFSFPQNQEDDDRTIAEVQMLQNAGINIPPELKASVFSRSKSTKSSLLPNNQSGKIPSGSTPYKSPIGHSAGLSGSNSNKIDEGITIDHLHKLNQNNVSAWSMKRLVRIVRYGALTTLDEHITETNIQEDESTTQIRSEVEAKAAARKIFRNVARRRSRYIYLDDLLRFMREDEALKTMSLFEGASESDRISKSALKNWVVHAFRERRALSLTLNDTKTAVLKLHKIVNVLVSVLIVVVGATWLNLITSKSLLFLSSQIVVVAFVFGNTCKNVFECIIFLFVIHPFDVGDRCEIDGVQMIVEEMNILTTVFLRFDNLKIVFPNYTLLTKPIYNFYRSPDMGDAIEVHFHIATPVEKITLIRQRIVGYIENKKEHWHPNPLIILKDMQELHMLKIAIWLQHRMNFQDMEGRWTRRALLIEECVKIFKELDIEYRIYPVNVNIHSISNLNYPLVPSNNWAGEASKEIPHS